MSKKMKIKSRGRRLTLKRGLTGLGGLTVAGLLVVFGRRLRDRFGSANPAILLSQLRAAKATADSKAAPAKPTRVPASA